MTYHNPSHPIVIDRQQKCIPCSSRRWRPSFKEPAEYCVWLGQFPPSHSGCLSLCPPMVEGMRKFSEVSFIRVWVQFLKKQTSWPLSKDHFGLGGEDFMIEIWREGPKQAVHSVYSQKEIGEGAANHGKVCKSLINHEAPLEGSGVFRDGLDQKRISTLYHIATLKHQTSTVPNVWDYMTMCALNLFRGEKKNLSICTAHGNCRWHK
jgi:hypothetical protein